MINVSSTPSLAPLGNVGLFAETLVSLQNRPAHLPGIGVFYGPAGYGKSQSACYAMNRYGAYYVEARSTWRKKQILQAILKEMSITVANRKTVSDMADLAAEQLAVSGRALIIDEFDYVVDKKDVEIIRDLYEASGAPILLVGEEKMPSKLAEWERFHSRIMSWKAAQPCTYEDARELQKLYLNGYEIADDLIERITDICNGVTRRICVNLNMVKDFCDNHGRRDLSLSEWGQQPFDTGRVPVRRIG